jgi:LysR family transcriptional activator of nhaA
MTRPLGPVGPLNYHHLRIFWMVAREGSVTRAAALLHLAQPTVSSQLRVFERDLGAPLLQRRGRSLALTDVGQVVQRYAEEIFAVGRELESALQGRETGRPVRFTVGISDALPKLTTVRLLAPALALTRPPLHLVCRIDKTERLIAELATHALDLVLTDAPAPPTLRVRCFNHLLGETDVTVFAPPAMARKLRARFPGSLTGAPFLLQTENTVLRRSLDQWFAAHGVAPRVVAELEDVALLQTLGGAGHGCFAAPTVVAAEIESGYGVRAVGRLRDVRERFYAVTVERRLSHPGVAAIASAARTTLTATRRR